jgi:hypothetical protein
MADGRICLSNNAAERALRGIAVGRHYAQPTIMRSTGLKVVAMGR